MPYENSCLTEEERERDKSIVSSYPLGISELDDVVKKSFEEIKQKGFKVELFEVSSKGVGTTDTVDRYLAKVTSSDKKFMSGYLNKNERDIADSLEKEIPAHNRFRTSNIKYSISTIVFCDANGDEKYLIGRGLSAIIE